MIIITNYLITTLCKNSVCVPLIADIIIRSSDIDLEFVKMLQHPSSSSSAAGTSSHNVIGGGNVGGHSNSHGTILTTTDGTNHVVYNLHTMSPTTNIISCDSIEETVDEADLTVDSTLDNDLPDFVICDNKTGEDDQHLHHQHSPTASSSSHIVLVASSQSPQNTQRCSEPIFQPSTIIIAEESETYVREDCDGKTKFTCAKCGSKFSALRNLKRHYNHECGIEPKHGCNFCPMRFKRRNLLKYHVLRKHTAKTEPKTHL